MSDTPFRALGPKIGKHAMTHPMLSFTGPHGPVRFPCGVFPSAIEAGAEQGTTITLGFPGVLKTFFVLESVDEVEEIFRAGLDIVHGTTPAEVHSFPRESARDEPGFGHDP